jgi:hypothetical protein
MELHTEERSIRMHDTLIRQIVGIDKERFPHGRETVGIYGKSVILGGDVTTTSAQVNTGLVHAPITVFQFVGLGSGGEGEELIAKADSKDGTGWV